MRTSTFAQYLQRLGHLVEEKPSLIFREMPVLLDDLRDISIHEVRIDCNLMQSGAAFETVVINDHSWIYYIKRLALNLIHLAHELIVVA